jgi:ketosteroid isomerase-like protein
MQPRKAGRFLGSIFFAAAVLICQNAPAARNADADSAALRRLLGQFDHDVQAGKLESMMSLFAEDVVLLGSGQPPVVGKAAVSAFWKSFLEQFNVQGGVHELDDVTNVGDAVVLQGRARATWIPKSGGSPVVTDNWFLHIYKRQPDGSLVLWRGAFGANAPAPATPK